MVVLVTSNIISGKEVTVKLESVKAHPWLEYKSKAYKTVLASGISVLFVHWFGTEGNYNAMVLDPLGSSLKFSFLPTS